MLQRGSFWLKGGRPSLQGLSRPFLWCFVSLLNTTFRLLKDQAQSPCCPVLVPCSSSVSGSYLQSSWFRPHQMHAINYCHSWSLSALSVQCLLPHLMQMWCLQPYSLRQVDPHFLVHPPVPSTRRVATVTCSPRQTCQQVSSPHSPSGNLRLRWLQRRRSVWKNDLAAFFSFELQQNDGHLKSLRLGSYDAYAFGISRLSSWCLGFGCLKVSLHVLLT